MFITTKVIFLSNILFNFYWSVFFKKKLRIFFVIVDSPGSVSIKFEKLSLRFIFLKFRVILPLLLLFWFLLRLLKQFGLWPECLLIIFCVNDQLDIRFLGGFGVGIQGDISPCCPNQEVVGVVDGGIVDDVGGVVFELLFVKKEDGLGR
jgi:hypothetical protein